MTASNPKLSPCRSPYCECAEGKCTHPGFYDARGEEQGGAAGEPKSLEALLGEYSRGEATGLEKILFSSALAKIELLCAALKKFREHGNECPECAAEVCRLVGPRGDMPAHEGKV